MAAYVQSTFNTTQLDTYGNVTLSGYLTTANAVAAAGTVGAIDTLTLTTPGSGYTNGTYTQVYLGGYPQGSFGYATVVVAGGVVTTVTLTTGGQRFTVGQVLTFSIPGGGTGATVTVATVDTRNVRPAYKGWTNMQYQYFTRLPVNLYNVFPGTTANFEYIVHSFKPPTGPISSIGSGGPVGYGYTDGTYTNVATVTGTFGSGATLDIVVSGGQVQSAVINNPGTNYRPGSTLAVAGGAIGPGTGFFVIIGSVSPVSPNGEPYWSQPPVLSPGSTGGDGFPPYSGGIYPVPDSPNEPPIDTL
jgi:hypothetical protein